MTVRLSAVLICLAFVLGAVIFAQAQALWVDETTQLSGLALPFDTQLSWLTGQRDPGLAVPPDRMPPLSYWLGGLWSSLFGLSETSMRAFGITMVLTAAPALWMTGQMAGGPRGGLFALGFVLLAPGMLIQAGEIRTYPLFFMLCAWAIWAFARILLADDNDRETGRLVAVAVFAVAAAYAHFFGLLMAACLFAVLLLDRLAKGLAPWRLLGVGALALLVAAGLVPFAMNAVGVTGGIEDMTGAGTTPPPGLGALLAQMAQLSLRLAVHGVHLAYLPALVLVLAGAALLAFLVLSRPGPGARPLMVLLPIALGLVLLAGIDRALDGFTTFAAHYNLWMVPLAALFLAFAFAPEAPRWRAYLASGAGLALVLGHLIANTALLRAPALYSHGPGEWIAAAIEDPAQTLIIHDGTGVWGHAYFPVVFLTDGAVTQALQNPDGLAVLVPGNTEPVLDQDAFIAEFETVLLVSARNLGSAELGAMARGAEACDPVPLPDSFAAFEIAAPKSYCAFVAATLARVE